LTCCSGGAARRPSTSNRGFSSWNAKTNTFVTRCARDLVKLQHCCWQVR
jgi:hypothetical protein